MSKYQSIKTQNLGSSQFPEVFLGESKLSQGSTLKIKFPNGKKKKTQVKIIERVENEKPVLHVTGTIKIYGLKYEMSLVGLSAKILKTKKS